MVVFLHGTRAYEQVERDFEEAVRVANAYIEWRMKQYTDS